MRALFLLALSGIAAAASFCRCTAGVTAGTCGTDLCTMPGSEGTHRAFMPNCPWNPASDFGPDYTETSNNATTVELTSDDGQWWCSVDASCYSPVAAPVSVSGSVASALDPTGTSIAGATVTYTCPSGTYTATTNSAGVYTLMVPPETCDLSISGDGYYEEHFTLDITGPITAGGDADAFLSPALCTGCYRFVVTWGDTPSDLDTHLYEFTPGSSSPCEVLWNSRSCTFSSLDVDDTSAHGPETLTVGADTGSGRGTMRYWIYNYSGGGTRLEDSHGHVVLYNDQGEMADFWVTSAGACGGTSTICRYWYIGDLNADTGVFTAANQLLTEAPGASLN